MFSLRPNRKFVSRKSHASRYHRLPLSLVSLEARENPSYTFAGGTADTTLDLTDANGVLASGATVALMPSQKNPTTSIDLGANVFNFYGTNYSNVFVSYNGLITFDSANDLAGNAKLGTTLSLVQPSIAPLWDTWFSTTSFDSKGVISKLDAATNKLYVQWDRMEDPNPENTASPDVTFQAILSLNSGITPGNIVFNYLDTATESPATADGQTATVGVKEKSSGSQPAELFTQVSHNTLNANVQSGKNITFTWSNTAPQNLALNLSATLINENDTITLGGSFTDPNVIDTHTININWGDGSADTVLTPTKGVYTFSGVTHQYLDNLPGNAKYTITATITDSQSAVSQTTTLLQVNNVTPTISFGANATINEGDTFTRSGTFADPGSLDATWVADVDYGDGSGKQSLSLSGKNFNLSHTYANQGTYTVTVYVKDKDNSTGQSTIAITTNNVLPTLTLDAGLGSPSVNEGASLVLANIASYSDPGLNSSEIANWLISWGDGTKDTQPLPGRTGNISGTHTYADNGTYTVTVSLLDDVGPAVTKTFLVNVNNVAPTVTLDAALSSTQNATEGQTITINTIGTFTDPGFNNKNNPNQLPDGSKETFTYTVNWGDGTTDTTDVATITQAGSVGVNTAGKFGSSHIFADDGTYTVTVTVTDDDSGVSTDRTFQVLVANSKPAITSPATNRSVNEGTSLVIPTLATFSDFGYTNVNNPHEAPAGSEETFTYSINWGDGTNTNNGSITNVTQGSTGVLTTGVIENISHTFADDGTYTVTLTITDDDAGSVSQQFNVTVGNVAPVVTVISNQTVNEGNTLTLPTIATFTDLGYDNAANPSGATQETFTYSISWGDGTSTVSGSGTSIVTGSAGTPTKGSVENVSHTYADNGTYTVTVTVNDDNSGSTDKTFTVTVNNVTPTIDTVSTDLTVNEGSSLNVANLVNFFDPGFNNPGNPNGASVESFTYSVNWGDGSANSGGNVTDVVNGSVGVSTTGKVQNIAHTYADNGKYTVTVAITDDDGAITSKTFQVTVDNVAPTVSIVGNQSVNEGSLLDIPSIVTFTDPGFNNPALNTLESFTYSVNWGDGTTADTGTVPNITNGGVGTPTSGLLNSSHTYADDGTYTVTVTITDDNSGSTTKTFQVVVNNVAPTVSIVGNKSVDEGSVLDIPSIVTFTDPGFNNLNNPSGASFESFTYSVNWGDGSTVETGSVADVTNGGVGVLTSGFLNRSHTYADDGTYTVSVTITDDNGGATTKSFQVTVNNVAPTVNIVGNKTINEGGLLDIPNVVTFTDPGFNNSALSTMESFTYSVNWGDGTTPDSGAVPNVTNGGVGVLTSGFLNASHTFADDGVYMVNVTITDDNGGATTKSFQVTVNNVTPTLAVAANQTIDEGALLSIATIGTFTDPGFNNAANPSQLPDGSQEKFSYTINWGDGTSNDGGPVTNVTQGSVGVLTSGLIQNASHTYADNGTYTVTLTLTDDDGGQQSKSFQVTVNNVAPTVSIVSDKTVTEGALLNIPNVVTFTDPGFNNPNHPNGASVESFTYSVNWGDGTAVESGTVANVSNGGVGVPTTGSLDRSHTFADDGTYTVTVTIADDNLGVTTKTFQVTVNNVAPTVNIVGDKVVNEGSLLGIPNIVTFTDPGFNNPNKGTVESFTYSVNWGDGSTVETGSVANVNNGGVGVATNGSFDAAHTYADNGIYTVMVTITDDNGGATTKTLQVTVTNVAPSVSVASDQVLAEGALLTLPVITAFTDPGFNNPTNIFGPSVESFTYSINWGDGSQPESGTIPNANVVDGGVGRFTTGSLGASHTYADNGVYTVSVTIGDDDLQATTRTFQVTVNNVTPTLSIVGNQTIGEGALLSLAKIAQWTDPGFNNVANPTQQPGGSQEKFSYTINWGDGTIPDSSGVSTGNITQGSPGTLTAGFLSADHTYADNGIYTVTVTLNDDDGASVSQQFQVTVSNTAPTLTRVANNLTTTEGGLVALPTIASISDPAFDNRSNPNQQPGGSIERFTYTINWGDGATDTNAVSNFATGKVGTPSLGSFGGSHTYADNGVYTVTASVLDDDTGLSNTVSFAVTVTNVAPTLNVSGLQSIAEGLLLDLAPIATFSDPGFSNSAGLPSSAEAYTYVVNWGDGSPNATGNATVTQNGFPGSLSLGTIAANHTYADDGNYTVTVTVTDDDGGTTTKSFTVNVLNTTPTLSVLAAQTFAEGETFSLPTIGTLRDQGFANPTNSSDESFTYSINWGDGTTPDTGTTTLTQVGSPGVPTLASFGGGHTFDRVGVFNVTVRVTDDNGGFDEKSFPITVTNVAPTLTLGNGNIVATEGITVNLPSIATFTDPGFSTSETYSYQIAWGDGEVSTGVAPVQLGGVGSPTSGTFGGSHAYGDNGLFTVRVTLTDSNGGTAQNSFTVQVNNTAPNLNLNVPSLVSIPEGVQLSLPNLASFSDPGFTLGERFSYSIAWGDGETSNGAASIFQVGGPDQPAFGKFGDAHTYSKNGDYPVTVSLVDKDGGSTSANFTVRVVNVAPTNLIYNLAPTPVQEGSVIELTGSFTDPGQFDPHTVTVDWGDGSPVATFSLLPGVTFFNVRNVGGNFLTHTYVQNSTGVGYPVKVTITDDAGLFTEQTQNVVVENVAPIVTIATPQKVVRDVRFVVTSDVRDPGVLDQLTYAWTVKDPSGNVVFTTNTPNLEYSAPRTGTYQLSLTVSDQDGGSTTTTGGSNSTTQTASIRVQNSEIFVVAADKGGGPRVAIFDSKTQQRITDFFAYEETYRGGVRVAVGDTQGDGTADIVMTTGPGGGPRVRVIDAETLKTLQDFFVYEESYRGGVFLAVGDVNGDGVDDIGTAADKGGGPRVKVVNGKTLQTIYDDFVFDPNLRNGTRVALNDVNGDGFADIVASSASGQSQVRAIDVRNNRILFDRSVFDSTNTGGVYVAAGDIQGDGRAEIIVAAGEGGSSLVRALDSLTGETVAQFQAYESSYTGGVRIAAFDYDGDGRADILTGTGAGGGPLHHIWKPFTNTVLETFFSFEETFLGGVYVGAGD